MKHDIENSKRYSTATIHNSKIRHFWHFIIDLVYTHFQNYANLTAQK